MVVRLEGKWNFSQMTGRVILLIVVHCSMIQRSCWRLLVRLRLRWVSASFQSSCDARSTPLMPDGVGKFCGGCLAWQTMFHKPSLSSSSDSSLELSLCGLLLGGDSLSCVCVILFCRVGIFVEGVSVGVGD